MAEANFDFEKNQTERGQDVPSIKDTNFVQRDLIVRSGRVGFGMDQRSIR